MPLLPIAVDRYIENHTSPASEILHALERDTHLNVLHPQMLSGTVQGAFLKLFSELLKPKRVLEIGTFTGYSAICLAQGMPEEGRLTTIEVNEELKERILRYVSEAGLSNKIELIIGSAPDVIPTLEGPFDLVFIDANKEQYLNYYHLVFDKVRKGGYIVADNVLWYGKVAEAEAQDRATEALREYNDFVQADERVENVLVSVRDGLQIAKKK